MLASELIRHLQALVDQHSDHPVVSVNACGSGDIDQVIFVEALDACGRVRLNQHEFQLVEGAA